MCCFDFSLISMALFLVQTLFLSCLPLVSHAAAPGTIAFYNDEICEEASHVNPSIKLASDICLVIHGGAEGVAVQTLPKCASGTATLEMYSDTSCTQPSNGDVEYGNCYFNGPNGIAALAFVCGDASLALAATTTSTVTAGPSILPVATGTGDSGSPTGAASSLPSAQITAASSGQTPASGGIIPAATSTSSNPPNPAQTTNTSSKSKSGGSGLSKGQQIGLGIGLPVAAIVVALVAWLWPKPLKKNRIQRPTEQSTWSPNSPSSSMALAPRRPDFQSQPSQQYSQINIHT